MNALRTLFATVNGGAGSSAMKMVLVVRSDLGLKKGKIASQCAHAAVLCCMRAQAGGGPGRTKLDAWLMQGQPKIVLRVDSLQEMHSLMERAETIGVVAEIVRDAGRTQVASGTETVLGLGPDSREAIDSLVGNLKLL
ncbi:probable peptidyl-tRNA hydrolase 2 [Anopheles stephensi]|uniref:probable peptidyl-tRNA hydrolase 2 n=1 Tax=Anopheles stephensi TaxID=30069 RepID=UPI001658A7A3|nr:probable peptidyl-tRNA hydrolase 2 [Anopheles stephensi]